MVSDRKRKLGIISSIAFVSFIYPFMVSALGVALPAMGDYFKISPGELGLIVTSYLLAMIILLLPIGKLADIVGLNRIYISGIVAFILVTFGICFSDSFNSLITLRFFQGLAVAMTTATSTAILTESFPLEQRGRVLGINIGAVYVGLSLGPFAGGIITNQLGWKHIFLIAGILSAVALILIIRNIPVKKINKEIRYNFGGAIQYAIYIILIWFGISYLQVNRLFGIFLIIGIAGFIYFVFRQYRSSNPIIDIRLLLENKSFSFGNLATLINYAASIAVTFTFSLYLQYIKGLNPKEAGMVLVIQPIVQMIFAPVSGRLSDKFNSNILVFTGMLFCFLGLAVVLMINQNSSMYLIYGLLIFFGLGFALFSSPNMNQIMSSVSIRYYGLASSMAATMRTIGMFTSISIASGAFTYFIGDRQMQPGLEELFMKGIRYSFIIFMGFSLIGLFISYRLLKMRTSNNPNV